MRSAAKASTVSEPPRACQASAEPMRLYLDRSTSQPSQVVESDAAALDQSPRERVAVTSILVAVKSRRAMLRL